jgi:predicted acyl esterase
MILLPMLAIPAYAADDFIVERDVMMPMRDGIVLAADIYRPAIDGIAITEPRPVLLTRTPYGKDTVRTVNSAEYYANRGYVAVIQDMRGRYRSAGEFTKYSEKETEDGYDTIEWLAKQPYADGRVGMWGTSYGAHTQADAAKLNPPSLKVLLMNEGGMANAWDHAVRHGGAFELGRELTWAFRYIRQETDDPVVRQHMDNAKIDDWYDAWPFRRGLSPLSVAPEYEEYIFEEYENSDYSDFWRRITLNWSDYYEQTGLRHKSRWSRTSLPPLCQSKSDRSHNVARRLPRVLQRTCWGTCAGDTTFLAYFGDRERPDRVIVDTVIGHGERRASDAGRGWESALRGRLLSAGGSL